MAELHGWFFDAYPASEGMRIWLIDEQGRPHALRDDFVPAFYARGPQEELRAQIKGEKKQEKKLQEGILF